MRPFRMRFCLALVAEVCFSFETVGGQPNGMFAGNFGNYGRGRELIANAVINPAASIKQALD